MKRCSHGSASTLESSSWTGSWRVDIVGDEGRIEIEIPFNAPPDRPCRIWHQYGSDLQEISLPISNQYTEQADLFAAAILDDTPVPTPIADAVANMQVIEAVAESGKCGGWVDVTTHAASVTASQG